MSGQSGSKESPISQAERAIIDYLKGDLRGSLSLVWHLVLEDLSLARKVKTNDDETTPSADEVAEAALSDMMAASEACYIAINILDSNALSSLVGTDAGRYWGLLSDIMSGLVELRGYLTMALNMEHFDYDRAKELSPVIREKVDELLRGIISELSASVAKREEELGKCKLDQER